MALLSPQLLEAGHKKYILTLISFPLLFAQTSLLKLDSSISTQNFPFFLVLLVLAICWKGEKAKILWEKKSRNGKCAKRIYNQRRIKVAMIEIPGTRLILTTPLVNTNHIPPEGERESKRSSPCPLTFASTACLKCQRRSSSTGRLGSSRKALSRWVLAMRLPSLMKETIL